MKKEYLYLLVTGISLIVIFVILLFIQNTNEKKAEQESQQPTVSSGQPSTDNSPSTNNSLEPAATTPDGVAKEFYSWYFSRPTNPLANGGFSKNMYLSDDFKDLLKESYKNGNDPVFCSDDSGSGAMVGDITYNETRQALVKISAGNAGGRIQYDVFRMSQIDGKWLIDDIHCSSS